MKAKLVIFVSLALLAATSLAWSQGLRSGEAAIFLKNGDLIIDEVVDISSSRFVLELKNSPEIPLRDLWMINFINQEYLFPGEIGLQEKTEHYFFLKNGDVLSGKVVDFSSTQRVFELETGEKIAIGSVRRVYFTKNVPEKYKPEFEPKQEKGIRRIIKK